MRPIVDAERVREFMRALGAEADVEARIYLTGGATAVLVGWRVSTIDIDLRIVPETDRIFRAIPKLKESLHVNVELASPADFIPEVPGWHERSPFIAREGQLSFHHYDFYAQALAKLERGHAMDLADVRAMRDRGLIDRPSLLAHFGEIEGRLYRYPAIDPPSFRASVENFAKG